jgi:hypothetical protein
VISKAKPNNAFSFPKDAVQHNGSSDSWNQGYMIARFQNKEECMLNCHPTKTNAKKNKFIR